MSKRQVIAFVIASFFAIVMFQNCGRSFEGSQAFSSVAFCKLSNQKTSGFAGKKVFLQSSVFSAQQKLAKTSMKISLLVDVKCLKKEKDLLFFDQLLEVPKAFGKFKKLAIDVNIPGSPSIEELEEEMAQSNCLLGLVEDKPIRRGQFSLTPQPVNDPQVNQQAHLTYLAHPVTRGLQDSITEQVNVAVIDTGIDYDHPDLTQRMWQATDGSYGYNFVANNNLPMDDDGHGTHVAGIIGAIENNSYAVAGLTGDYVRLMAIKVLDSNGAGFSSDIQRGIQFAIANGVDIINLSIESDGRNQIIEDAVQDAVNAGVVVVGATGNQSREITSDSLFAPAYLGPSINGMISVASVDTTTGFLSTFSNYSRTYTEMSAPGAQVSSGSPTTGGILSTARNGQWTRIKGTSQATPMVASAAAMLIGFLKTEGITYNPSGIESFLKTDASRQFNNLSGFVENGRQLHLGFMAQNLSTYLAAETNPDFQGVPTAGNSCVIP